MLDLDAATAALHYTGQMFLRLGLATVIVVGNTLIMKEQITLYFLPVYPDRSIPN